MSGPPKQIHGMLRAIARRPTDGEPMVEVSTAELVPGRGITSENRKPGPREVTLLSVESWRNACQDLGTDLPWYLRRANLLIEGVDLAAAIGAELRVGAVRLKVHGETRPCGIMDQQQDGLKQALIPQCRGGVHAQVLEGGVIRVGDAVERIE